MRKTYTRQAIVAHVSGPTDDDAVDELARELEERYSTIPGYLAKAASARLRYRRKLRLLLEQVGTAIYETPHFAIRVSVTPEEATR